MKALNQNEMRELRGGQSLYSAAGDLHAIKSGQGGRFLEKPAQLQSRSGSKNLPGRQAEEEERGGQSRGGR